MKKKEKFFSGFLFICLITTIAMPLLVVRAEPADPSTFWMTLANNSWNYFQPDVGVNSKTGLPQNAVGSSYFTDWDAGVYVQAVIDAKKLGLIEQTGTWGFNDRINRFLSFLETRPLMYDGLPYLAYNSATGKNANQIQQVATDAGCLFVALKNLEDTEPTLKPRIDNIVYELTNYTRRQHSVDILLGQTQDGTRQPNIYDYYVTCGFAGFWPQRFSAEADSILNLIVSAPVVNYSGIALPSAKITSDPLLMSIFNLDQVDPRILTLSEKTYLAQELRYNLTGKYTAFSEGFTNGGFIWEWIVLGDGRMWVIQTGDSNDVDTDIVGVSPIIYLKAATGLLAIYNTNYTEQMVNCLLQKIPASKNGYLTGVDENGHTVFSSDFGNGLILSAARYAVDNKAAVNLSCPTVSPTAPATSSQTQTQMPPPNTASPTSTLHPTNPPTLNTSDAASEPKIFPPSTPTTKTVPNQSNILNLTSVAISFYVSVAVCVFGAAGYMLAKKRLATSNSMSLESPERHA